MNFAQHLCLFATFFLRNLQHRQFFQNHRPSYNRWTITKIEFKLTRLVQFRANCTQKSIRKLSIYLSDISVKFDFVFKFLNRKGNPPPLQKQKLEWVKNKFLINIYRACLTSCIKCKCRKIVLFDYIFPLHSCNPTNSIAFSSCYRNRCRDCFPFISSDTELLKVLD